MPPSLGGESERQAQRSSGRSEQQQSFQPSVGTVYYAHMEQHELQEQSEEASNRSSEVQASRRDGRPLVSDDRQAHNMLRTTWGDPAAWDGHGVPAHATGSALHLVRGLRPAGELPRPSLRWERSKRVKTREGAAWMREPQT